MALSAAQKLDIRRYAGYPAAGTDPGVMPPAYVAVNVGITTLESRLENLTAEEESVIIGYLTNLAVLESDLMLVRDTIDTETAAVWKRNPRELNERRRLYNGWRRDLCDFIGVDYGPGLGSGLTVVRG